MPVEPSPRSVPVRLDLVNECLWREEQAIPLRPKTFGVLRYMVAHAGQLVSKAALLEAVWPATAVGDGGLMVCIRELRRALEDDARTPHFIETVHRRGYRFIGHLPTVRHPSPLEISFAGGRAVTPIGREAEMAQLHRWLEQALHGRRQVVFVTGEAGLGKTTLVEAFVEAASRRDNLWLGRGQCIEHYGAGEAYMPVLAALGRLCRAAGGEDLVALLTQHAPTWLVQMPGLLSTVGLETLQRRLGGGTRERMLRELAEAVEVLTAAKPLVLVLEDLHWSDYSTLDLVAVLARRQEPARLLLLGTYRPAEVTMGRHPLHAVKQDLQGHGLCAEQPLTLLTQTAVGAYLAARFPDASLPPELTRFVYQRTDGNPLFMVNVVDDWLNQGWLIEAAGRWTLQVGLDTLSAGVPENLRQLINQQVDRLNAQEQRVLEAGSVAGIEFSAAAVAAALETEVPYVDEQCGALVQRLQLLQEHGEHVWPDGTVSGCYGFAHALYQAVIYTRLTAGQRIHLHRRIGERQEKGYGPQAGKIAAELAMHFERGRDYARAIAYLQQAADTAVRRYANAEATHHLSKGLALLTTFPATPERDQQELLLQAALGASLMAVKGFGAGEVERAYGRAKELCERVGDTPQLGLVLFGLLQFYMMRTAFQTAEELGKRLIRLAHGVHDLDLLLAAHNGLGTALSYRGELDTACTHLQESIGLYDPDTHLHRVFFYGTNLKIDSLAHLAHVLWLLGAPKQALQHGREALRLAQTQEPLHPFTLAHVANLVAIVYHLRREERQAQEQVEVGRRLADTHGFAPESGRGAMLQGWALVVRGEVEAGLEQMRQTLEAYRATGAEIWRPYYLALLAETYGKAGQRAEGLHVLTEAIALVSNSGGHWWEAELYRLQGTLLLMQDSPGQRLGEVEACFHHALNVARRQQAKSLELRAATSLACLWQSQGKRQEARDLLASVYAWFTEGFDTADLKEAKALLEDLR